MHSEPHRLNQLKFAAHFSLFGLHGQRLLVAHVEVQQLFECQQAWEFKGDQADLSRPGPDAFFSAFSLSVLALGWNI